MKILITGAFSSLNKGDEARVRSTTNSIRSFLDDVDFGFLSAHPSLDKRIYDDLELDIVNQYEKEYTNRSFLITLLKSRELLSRIPQAMFWRISNKTGNKFLKEFIKYDVFLDLSGESLSDYFGQINLFFCLYQIYLGILLRKSVVIYAQSIGPFDDVIGRRAASYVLNRVNLITVRDEESLKNLQKYEITKPPIYLTADPAFNLMPASSERISSILNEENININHCLIGVSISRGSFKRSISEKNNLDDQYKEYIQTMSRVIDYVIEKLNAEIIFIPHVIAPTEDDRLVYNQIYKKVYNKEHFKMLLGNYTSEELKGVIGNCDLFISSRMHPIIAALSMNVPTIAISYSHKMPSLMHMVGQDAFVFDLNDITFEAMRLKIDSIWEDRKTIKKDLLYKADFMRKMGMHNAEILKQLINA